MLIEPAIPLSLTQTTRIQSDTSNERAPFTFLETLQALSGCYIIATTIDRIFMHNQLTVSALWATNGFTAGILVKKVVSVYTRLHNVNAFLLENSERYPYAFGVAMLVSILASFVFPTFGAICIAALGFLSGFIFDLQAF